MDTDEHAIITQDRLIIATGALEEIRRLGGRAARIAGDTLDSFARADACEHANQSNGLMENLHGPQIAYTYCADCGKVLWREDEARTIEDKSE